MPDKYADMARMDRMISIAILIVGMALAVAFKIDGEDVAARLVFFGVAGFVFAVNALILVLRVVFP